MPDVGDLAGILHGLAPVMAERVLVAADPAAGADAHALDHARRALVAGFPPAAR